MNQAKGVALGGGEKKSKYEANLGPSCIVIKLHRINPEGCAQLVENLRNIQDFSSSNPPRTIGAFPSLS